MKVLLQGVTVLDQTFGSAEEIVDRYRQEELEHGREVPRYSWEALVLVVGGWLLKKVADDLYKWVVEYRKRRKDGEEKKELRTLEERRHHELLAKLDELIAARGTVPPKDTEWFESLLLQGHLAIEIRSANEAEDDFLPAFEQRLQGLGNALVIVPVKRGRTHGL